MDVFNGLNELGFRLHRKMKEDDSGVDWSGATPVVHDGVQYLVLDKMVKKTGDGYQYYTTSFVIPEGDLDADVLYSLALKAMTKWTPTTLTKNLPVSETCVSTQGV